MLQFCLLSTRNVGQKVVSSYFYRYSSVSSIIFKNNVEKTDIIEESPQQIADKVTVKATLETNPANNVLAKPNNLVKAAFASLKSDATTPVKNVPKKSKKSPTDDFIEKATTVNELLTIAETPIVSRKHALKVVSILASWSSEGRIKLTDFETDSRFQKLCRILGRTGSLRSARTQNNNSTSVGDDLSTVLGVTGDDEAAKLVASISVSQMVKILSALAQKGRRSTPLLRSLAYNITKSSEKLDLKQSADVLYAAAVLTFPEIPLLERACTDLIVKLPQNTDRSAVVGSILTSIGMLRYKNTEVLDILSEWIVKHHEICRPQDIFALLITLAVVNYRPNNIDNLQKVVVPQLNILDSPKSSSWIDLVWSLIVLNIADVNHVRSALKPEFIARLKDENSLTVATKIKLLNIQAAAELLLSNYSGPFLPENSDIKTVTIVRSKEKQSLVAAMLDTLGNLLQSATYLKSNIDTGMGFLIDGECFLDKKGNPLPVPENEQTSEGIKIAFMAYDYHDICRGNRLSPIGMNALAERLLEKKGYNIITVPFSEFNPRDKLIRRVQYLESHIKNIVKQKSSSL